MAITVKNLAAVPVSEAVGGANLYSPDTGKTGIVKKHKAAEYGLAGEDGNFSQSQREIYSQGLEFVARDGFYR